MIGEIDTKPIESVQNAISFFGHGNDQRKNCPKKDEHQEEKDRQVEILEKELANIKVQLEAKDLAHKQALLKIDHHQKTSDQLSTLLKNSDLQKDFYINESCEAKARINELESTIDQMSRHLSKSEKAQDHLKHVINDLESQLALLKESKIESLSQIQAMERALNELNQLKEDMGMQEKKSLDQVEYISLLETELKQLRTDLEKSKEQENEAQVEIALLKSDLHKGRSKLAASEAAESRAQSEKTALYNALQQMGVEAEEVTKENKLLKEAMKMANETQEHEGGTILVKENEGLIEKVDQSSGDGTELESVKKELEIVMAKNGELRMRAEQAISRAEAAEKMKSELEKQIKKRKEQKERRKAAIAALREESILRDYDSMKNDDSVENYQPLGKVLNMKF